MESPTPSLQSPSSNPLTVRGNNPYTHINIHNVLLRMQKPVFTGTPGVVPDMDGKLPIDYFRLMFDDRVLNLILTETTRYAEQYLEREEAYLEQHPKARAHDWRRNPLSMKELEVFLSIVLAMGMWVSYNEVTNANTHTHAYTHTHANIIHTHTCIHTHTHATYTHTCIHTHTHATYTHICIHTHTHTHANIIHTHTCIYTHTQYIHTHMHTHACMI